MWIVVALAGVSTNVLIGSVGVRLPGGWTERVAPLPEIAALLTGLVGTALIAPRLTSWEATGARNLAPYAGATATVMILLSSAAVLLPILTLADNLSPGLTDAEWRAEALAFLVPHALGVATLVSIGLIAVSRLGAWRGLTAGLAVSTCLVLLQTNSSIGHLVPLAGAPRPAPLWAIVVTALVVTPAAIIVWSRSAGRHRTATDA